MKKLIQQNYHSIGIWLLLGLLSILFFRIYGNLAQDDAFITFRYAKNIAAGKGFVYNEGEWVLGTTTPLYTLVLAAAAYLTKADIVPISIFINILSLWVASGIFFELGKKAQPPESAFLALIFITNPLLRNFIGMESYFLLCFLLLTIYCYLQKKYALTGILNGFLILIRYEMVFLSFILFVWDVIKNKKFPWWMVSGGILVLIWVAYAYFVFGSPIPLSASAKLAAPKHSFLVGGAAYIYLLIKEFPLYYLVFLIAVVGIWGTIKFISEKTAYLFLLVFSLLYWGAASLFAGSFPWYYAPLLPGFSILVLFGIHHLSMPPRFVIKKWKKTTTQHLSWVLFLVVFSLQVFFLGKSFYTTKDQFGDNRFFAYKQIADLVKTDPDVNKSIASFEIGYLGYYSESKIIDIAGLVSPELLPWVGDGAEESLFHTITIFSPKYIVVPYYNTEQIKIIEESQSYQLMNRINNIYDLYIRE